MRVGMDFSRVVGGRRAIAIVAGLTAAALLIASAPTAEAALRDFSLRYGENVRGNVAFASNTLMECPVTDVDTCQRGAAHSDPNASNNNRRMNRLDVDGFVDANNDGVDDTETSSRAVLSVPPGAEVLFAGLYWAGHVPDDFSAADPDDANAWLNTLVDPPGAGGYQAVTGSELDTSGPIGSPPNVVHDWNSFVDVTSIVRAAGPGEYTVGGVPLQFNGTYRSSTSASGGWALWVAYADPSEPWRNLSIFDGFQGPTQTFPVSGFVTPPTGSFNTAVGVSALEGDAGLGGDAMQVNGVNLQDALTPANNFFNSRITRFGVDDGDRTPNFLNQLGWEAKLVDADAVDANVVPNGATSADVTITSSGDGYQANAIATAIDIYAPDVSGTKQIANVTDPGQPAEPNDVLEYTIDYSDADGAQVDSASNVAISDPIPPNMTYVPGTLQVEGSGRTDAPGDDTAEVAGGSAVFRVGAGADQTSGGTLAPGEGATVSFRVQVNANSPGHLSTNTATADFTGATLGPDNPFSEQASASIPVTPVHDLALDKSGPATVLPGQNLTYTLDVTNNGPSTSDQTTLTDTLPGGLTYDDAASDSRCDAIGQAVTCNLGSMAGGANTSVSIVAAVPSDAAAGSLLNSANVTDDGDTPEANPDNNTDSATTEVLTGTDLALTKTPSTPVADVDDQVTYTLAVTNNGPLDTASAQVVDTLPDGLAYVDAASDAGCDQTGTSPTVVTCDLGAIASGDSAQSQIAVDVLPGASGTRQTNTATVSGSNPETDPTNNDASANVDVPPIADLVIVKSGSPDPVDADADITYMLDVSNVGPTDSVVRVTDSLPAGLVYYDAASDPHREPGAGQDVVCDLTLLAGESDSLTIVAHVPAGASGTLHNVATIESTDDPSTEGIDPVAEADPSNNTATLDTQIRAAESDLGLQKTAPPGPFKVGDQIPYTLTVTNEGPDDSPNTVVTDKLPAGLSYVSDTGGCSAAGSDVTCNLGTIASNETKSFTMTARVDSVTGTSVSNSARVSGPNHDLDAGDDGASAVAALAPVPPVATPKTKNPRCFFGHRVTILGTNRPERIVGTPGRDVINGKGGNDVILGRGGDDLICGGGGDDLIIAGRGNDRVKGSLGDDRIRGNLGDDWLRGAPGDDLITGRRGKDKLMGNAGDDHLWGRQGNDFLLGGPGFDWGNGGPGFNKALGLDRAFNVEG